MGSSKASLAPTSGFISARFRLLGRGQGNGEAPRGLLRPRGQHRLEPGFLLCAVERPSRIPRLSRAQGQSRGKRRERPGRFPRLHRRGDEVGRDPLGHRPRVRRLVPDRRHSRRLHDVDRDRLRLRHPRGFQGSLGRFRADGLRQADVEVARGQGRRQGSGRGRLPFASPSPCQVEGRLGQEGSRRPYRRFSAQAQGRVPEGRA